MKRINSNFSTDPNYRVITHCGCEHGKSAHSLGLMTYTSLTKVKELPKSVLPVNATNKCSACDNSGVVFIDYGTHMALKKDPTNRDARVIFNAYFVQGRKPPRASRMSKRKRLR